MIETLSQLISSHAAARPESPALLGPGRGTTSYGALWHWIAQQKLRLEARVAPGARIAVSAANGPEMAALYLLASCHGVAVPLSPALTPYEALNRLRALNVAAVLLDPSKATGLAAAAEQLKLMRGHASAAPDLPAGLSKIELISASSAAPMDADRNRSLLLCTAGTSGEAKTIPYEHAQLLRWGSSVTDYLALDASSRCLNVMPFFHSHGLLVALIGSLWAGGSVVCTRGLYLPHEWWHWLETLQPDWFTAVPSVLEVLLSRLQKHGAPHHRLRFIRTGSAPMRPEVRAALEEALDIPVVSTYGMTEVLGWLACAPLERASHKLGAVGRASDGVTVLDESGKELARGQQGEIAITVERCLTPLEAAPTTRDRFRRSGDLGFIDADGFIFLTGRSSDVIQRSGEKIAPQEIERVFCAHPDVVEVVSFGMPSDRHGQDVGLAVVARPGRTLEKSSLQALAAERLSPEMIPRRIFIVPELPKTEAGKISRRRIAEWLVSQEGA